MLPLAYDDMKFEMLPPGQEATRSMPRATMGVMTLLNANATRSVTKGSAIHCIMQPTMIDFGWRKTSLKVSSLMPSATPNITSAKMMLTRVISPAPKLGSRGSKIFKNSFIRYFVNVVQPMDYFGLISFEGVRSAMQRLERLCPFGRLV